MKKKIIITAIIFIIISVFIIKSSVFENKKNLKCSQLSKQNSFLSGEWYNIKDSTSGISVRGNKIAFFKNSQFNGEEIYGYKLIDSIYECDNIKNKIGEFIMMTQIHKDTIYKKIIAKNDSVLTLEIDNKNITFNRKGLIKFREKN
jgi:hypothetical protein